jgi:hypothetical protein
MPLNGTLAMELGAAIGVMMKVFVVGYLGWHKEYFSSSGFHPTLNSCVISRVGIPVVLELRS